MPDMDKPVTAQEAVEAYNAIRRYCKQTKACSGCVLQSPIGDTRSCFIYGSSDPENDEAWPPNLWPKYHYKEAPDA